MRAALATGGGAPIEIGDVALDPPGRGEVTVRIEASAVCRTDDLINQGPSTPGHPWIPGHSASGVVVAVGGGTSKTVIGDRVVVAGTMECGRCFTCRNGSPSQCERLAIEIAAPPVVGRTADGRPVVGIGGAGTFAEMMTFREHCFAVVDTELDAVPLALLGCGGLSGVGAVWEVAEVRPGDRVLVLGCGHLGLWMIQAARAAGAGEIIAIDPIAARREIALRLGATAAAPPEEAEELVLGLTGRRGADVALEATGEPGGVEAAFAMTRNGATLVATSMIAPLDSATISLPATAVALFGRSIRGSQSGGGHLNRDIQRVADAIAAGRLDVDAMISATFPLEHVARAMQAAVDREVITAVLDLRPHPPASATTHPPTEGSTP